MKNLSFILVLITLSISSAAQPSKGDFLIGGSTRFSVADLDRQNGYETSGYSFSILTREGYFLNDNIALGLISGYGRGKTALLDKGNNQEMTDFSRTLSAGLFMRYYKLAGEEKRFAFIAEPRATFDFTERRQEVYLIVEDLTKVTSGAEVFTAAVSINPSIAYFIGKKAALELSLGGVGYKWINDNPTISLAYPRRSRSFYADINLMSASVGITFNL